MHLPDSRRRIRERMRPPLAGRPRVLDAVGIAALVLALALSWLPGGGRGGGGDPLVGRVAAVLDGDTARVALPSGETSVRVIGIDTPEIPHPGRPAGCFGEEARRVVDGWLAGRQVRVVPGVEPRDRYGRLLASITPLDGPLRGRDLALALARRGLARPLPIAPNTANAARVGAAVADARRHRRGLWGRCGLAAAFPRAVRTAAPLAPRSSRGRSSRMVGAMHPLQRSARLVAGAAACAAAYGLVEAGNVGLRELDLPVRGLPPALDGLRVLHVSDLHLGTPGVGRLAVGRAQRHARAARPELICVTGDLRSHERGAAATLAAIADLAALAPCVVVRGNHDAGSSRDPFAGGAPLVDVDGTGAILLDDDVAELELRGVRVALGGVRPETWPDDERAACAVVDAIPDAPLRILLCHFPEALDHVAGRVQLVLAGHMHGGQLVLPYPGGRVRLACPLAAYPEGTWGRAGTVLRVTRGVGTTFVPFRFLARPEVNLLRLRVGGSQRALSGLVPSEECLPLLLAWAI